MLLIWDIHINSQYSDDIIGQIKNYVTQNNNEKNIVFLWDYVYHFAYDRDSLLKLFNLFIDFIKQWKNLYIIAWNHDRLWNNFVFAEAEIAFNIIKNFENKNIWNIKFITSDTILYIEWKKILFFPYSLEYSNINIDTSKYNMTHIQSNILETIKILENSKEKNKKISAKINKKLLKHILDNWNEKLYIIHHFYVNETKFPSIKSIFRFNDIAISNLFLDIENIKLISGHIHQVFSYKNYICLWSIRANREDNVIKFLIKRDTNNDIFIFNEIQINNYITIEQKWDEIIWTKKILDFYKTIQNMNKDFFVSEKFHTEFNFLENINFKKIILQIVVDELDYEKIETFVEEQLRHKIKNTKLKKKFNQTWDLINELKINTEEIKYSANKWLEYLKIYIEKNYQDESWKYIKILKELKIL